jgi:hypothetical protein
LPVALAMYMVRIILMFECGDLSLLFYFHWHTFIDWCFIEKYLVFSCGYKFSSQIRQFRAPDISGMVMLSGLAEWKNSDGLLWWSQCKWHFCSDRVAMIWTK